MSQELAEPVQLIKIKTGLAVQLISGGNKMTVLSVEGDNAKCCWFGPNENETLFSRGGDVVHYYNFPIICLRIVS